MLDFATFVNPTRELEKDVISNLDGESAPIYYPGKPFPLGASWDGMGVNFAIYSENASAVHLCLFNPGDLKNESAIITIEERDNHIWHVYVPGLMPGQLYGYRVHGKFDPCNGHRFNANKLLLDPYAKAISGVIDWNNSIFGYETDHDDLDLSFSEENDSEFVPKSVVIDHRFDWENVQAPNIPYHKTVIYEAHVKGFTRLHPDIPEHLRGTYAGLGHPVTIKYMKELGITAVELMPVHHYVADRNLVEKGLTNYWGYNTIGFFAPDVRYSSSGTLGEQVNEFKEMVKALHSAGIEVILDVVYNHTAEGNHLGPTLSFRGIDNACYYRLLNVENRFCMDYTGTGNTLNAMMPTVLRMIMDSLRYWIIEMHVDGFRFDLAPALARELHEVDRLGSFFDIIHQDPVISQVKLIAEPWDIGEGGYQIGKFPPGWAEWNGKYRDCVRDFWRGTSGVLPEFAQRITGSADLYESDYRRPTASINFITAHDGFTLHDLVSYNEKHNAANGENNMDGENHNRSFNYGVEGPTDDIHIRQLREKQKRNLLTTMFISQGVPMLVAGDELGRTQSGNNNAYCQDNEVSWINWQNADHELFKFTKDLISFCKKHPIFSRRRWFKGKEVHGSQIEDIAWFSPEGKTMQQDVWEDPQSKSVGVFLNGNALRLTDDRGRQLSDDDFYIVFNATEQPLTFKLPPMAYGGNWMVQLDTADISNAQENTCISCDSIAVSDRSIVILKSVK